MLSNLGWDFSSIICHHRAWDFLCRWKRFPGPSSMCVGQQERAIISNLQDSDDISAFTHKFPFHLSLVTHNISRSISMTTRWPCKRDGQHMIISFIVTWKTANVFWILNISHPFLRASFFPVINHKKSLERMGVDFVWMRDRICFNLPSRPTFTCLVYTRET